MTPDIMTQIRVFLTAIGGYLVGKGHVNQAIMEASIGLIIILIPAIWGWWSNRPGSKEAVQVAESVAGSALPQTEHIAFVPPPPPGIPERRQL